MRRPLVIDLFCGLGGWTKGFLAEDWDAVGFDIERHQYGDKQYPAQLVLQDVLTLDGRQFRGRADMIVASPPCQRYSYMAMPFNRGRREASWLRWDRDSPLGHREEFEQLNALFNACFRIAREAELPLVVENVKGAQPWVGRAQANFGSYYLWGDIANVGGRIVRPDVIRFGMASVKALGRGGKNNGGSWFGQRDGVALERNDPRDMRRNPETGEWENAEARGDWNHPGKRCDAGRGTKNDGGSWFNVAHNTTSGTGRNPVHEGVKVSGDWFGSYAEQKAAGTISPGRLHGKRSVARKAASAQIAEIPFDLAQWIARCFKP